MLPEGRIERELCSGSLFQKTWGWRGGFPLDMGAAGAEQGEMSQEVPMRSFTDFCF